ncbi:hypothetical protein Cgig2_033529 [Carnegiea gigantea]|uniref:Uncharacterized protein n=1 Tax=Carnegiea gigantea TaxID=171969 RepID=A0A9Q1K1R3_9CARY|nr:hypothetical protein Cgig2_033529 [Carnegiea gigantea]
MAFPPIYSTREMVNYVRESFVRRWRRAPRPPRSLPEDFHTLCPHFLLFEAEGAAVDFELPEMVKVTFYAMLLNEAVELGVVHGFIVEGLKSALVGLRWLSFKVWMSCVDHVLREAQLQRPADEVEVRGPWTARKRALDQTAPRPPIVMRSSLSFVSNLFFGDVPEGLVSPRVEGRHPQFPSLPAFINGRVVAGVPRKNKCREPKKIPYAVPLFEPDTPSWSSCKYSPTPSVLSPELEVTYPWRSLMAKTKSTPHIRSPDELLAGGTQGNPCSAPSSSKPGAEVAFTSSSSTSGGASSSSSSDSSSRSSSSEGASTSSSSPEGPSALGKSVLKRKGRAPKGLVAEGPEFPRAPTRSDP